MDTFFKKVIRFFLSENVDCSHLGELDKLIEIESELIELGKVWHVPQEVRIHTYAKEILERIRNA